MDLKWKLRMFLRKIKWKLFKKGIAVQCLWQKGVDTPEAKIGLVDLQPGEVCAGNFYVIYNGKRISREYSFDIHIYEDKYGEKRVNLYVPVSMLFAVQ